MTMNNQEKISIVEQRIEKARRFNEHLQSIVDLPEEQERREDNLKTISRNELTIRALEPELAQIRETL